MSHSATQLWGIKLRENTENHQDLKTFLKTFVVYGKQQDALGRLLGAKEI